MRRVIAQGEAPSDRKRQPIEFLHRRMPMNRSDSSGPCPRRIVIVADAARRPHPEPSLTIITLTELRSMLTAGAGMLGQIFRYEESTLLVHRLDFIPRPLLCAIAIRVLSRKKCHFIDESGEEVRISAKYLAGRAWRAAAERFRKGRLVRDTILEIRRIEAGPDVHGSRRKLNLAAPTLYLRTDLVYGLTAGGSVAHISGVLNNLDRFAGKPFFVTTDRIPNVREDIPVRLIEPGGDFWDYRELPSIQFSDVFYRKALAALGANTFSFVYQRYSLNNFSGLRLSRTFGVPFVLEYNGSEIWVHRHWMRPLKYESLSARIEKLNLESADLIVVVSRPSCQELTARGIDPRKILVNPNGVDPVRYSPEVDGGGVRDRLGLRGKVVIGFIGTFGQWHGAEMLADSFGLFLRDFPEYRQHVRLLMIGDGVTMPLVKSSLETSGARDYCVLTGRVLQEEGPFFLAACDILVSPHVPNPDGTPFFGSPTKLFEYMAMGKGIVASDLEQIGEILEHGRTAWLVRPGDAVALMDGMKRLVDDINLRNRLGEAAREVVLEKYTWAEHTRRIIEHLGAVCS